MLDEELMYEEIYRILRIPTRFRQDKHINSLMNHTLHVDFFKKISIEHNSSEIHRQCCQIMSLEEYSTSDIIINFGEQGEKFYIILKGSVSVLIPVKERLTVPRNESPSPQRVLISRNDSSSSSDEDIDQIPIPKKVERREGIAVASVSEIIKNLQKERNAALAAENSEEGKTHNEVKLITNLFSQTFRKEKKDLIRVVKEADNEFIEIEVDKLLKVDTLMKGSAFGELALISDRPRAATIIADQRTSLLVIKKYQFKRILGEVSERRLFSKIRYLQSLNYFSGWSKSALTKISLYFHNALYQRNQFIYYEGQPVREIFFIKEGEMLITKKCRADESVISPLPEKSRAVNKNRKILLKNKVLKLCYKGKNESTGAYEVINSRTTRIFSCMCDSTTAEVFYISKEHFFSRIPNVEFIKEIMTGENARLMERYEELYSHQDPADVFRKIEVRLETPKPKRNVRLKSMKFLLENVGIMSSKSCKNTPVPPKNISVFRQLTPIEVDQAVNGRFAKSEAKPKRTISMVRRRSPPPSFMQKSRANMIKALNSKYA